MELRGIITPIVTPFAADGSLDWPAWERVIEHQIGQGAHGLIVGGTTGEFYSLTDAERVRQFRRARQVVGGRVPVLGGVNALRVDECPALAAEARAAGLDGLLVAPPPYSQPTPRELAAHCLRIDRAAGLPVMLYNYPGRSGTDMGEEFLSRVGRSANFQAIKESSGDIGRLHLLAREFPQLRLFCGADDQALEFYAWGAVGWVCGAANCIPAESRAFHDCCATRRDFDTGRRLMMALLPMMVLLERSGKYIQCVKRACDTLGIPGGGPTRPPMRPLTKEEARRVDETIATLTVAVRNALEEPPR